MMRRLYYIAVFLVALIVLDAIANDSRYTRPFIDMIGSSAQRLTSAVEGFVGNIFRWGRS
jgi:hypothetical protein